MYLVEEHGTVLPRTRSARPSVSVLPLVADLILCLHPSVQSVSVDSVPLQPSSVLRPPSLLCRRTSRRSSLSLSLLSNGGAKFESPYVEASRAVHPPKTKVSVSSSWALSWVFLAFSDKHWPSTPPSLDVSLTLSIYVQYLSASITFPAKL